jgi:hypothetical protein
MPTTSRPRRRAPRGRQVMQLPARARVRRSARLRLPRPRNESAPQVCPAGCSLPTPRGPAGRKRSDQRPRPGAGLPRWHRRNHIRAVNASTRSRTVMAMAGRAHRATAPPPARGALRARPSGSAARAWAAIPASERLRAPIGPRRRRKAPITPAVGRAVGQALAARTQPSANAGRGTSRPKLARPTQAPPPAANSRRASGSGASAERR